MGSTSHEIVGEFPGQESALIDEAHGVSNALDQVPQVSRS